MYIYMYIYIYILNKKAFSIVRNISVLLHNLLPFICVYVYMCVYIYICIYITSSNFIDYIVITLLIFVGFCYCYYYCLYYYCYNLIFVIIITIIIIELTHSKTILEIAVEIEPEPAVLDFKNLSQYFRRSK